MTDKKKISELEKKVDELEANMQNIQIFILSTITSLKEVFQEMFQIDNDEKWN